MRKIVIHFPHNLEAVTSTKDDTLVVKIFDEEKPEEPARPVWMDNSRPSTRHVLANNTTIVHLGMVDHYEAAIVKSSETSRVRFLWGCRTKNYETGARNHWPNNKSVMSGDVHPHATELIDYVAAYCKWKGWEW